MSRSQWISIGREDLKSSLHGEIRYSKSWVPGPLRLAEAPECGFGRPLLLAPQSCGSAPTLYTPTLADLPRRRLRSATFTSSQGGTNDFYFLLICTLNNRFTKLTQL